MKRAKGRLAGIAIALWCCTLAEAQISPGPLSRAHQQLEGVTKCASCHDFGAGSRGFRCLECHAEIRRRVDAHLGYHARAYKPSSSQVDCDRCHMDHNGEKFEITRLDRKNWDHDAQTGFLLEGKHREQKCEKCHAPKHISAAARSEIKVKDLNHTFLGLNKQCLSCHEDQHQGKLDKNCLRCHGQDAWKPAPGFNHSKTNYPLTGQHQTVACQKCHGPKPDDTKVQYKGLITTGCQSCHNDPHRGAFTDVKFRGSCETCHNTSGWKNNHPNESFNHNTTKFPLTGKHSDLVCAKCHKKADFHQPVAHEFCKDCHEDTHKGQFATRKAGSDCGSCHNDTGFKPAKFDRKTHQQSAFPLEGKHASLDCVKCHVPAGKDALYINHKTTCAACHADKHDKEFESAPWKNECDRCHTQTEFTPSTFTVEHHAKTKFALAGKHATTKCGDCHKPLTPTTKEEPRIFHFFTQTCNTCHSDPHQTKLSCETCHTTSEWKDARPFDHSTTKFQLTGAHKESKCLKCHSHVEPAVAATWAVKVVIPAAFAESKTAPGFGRTETECFKCHDTKDPHRSQFLSADLKRDCSYCHVTAQWETKEKEFDHNKTRYGLDISHRNVQCVKCHKEERQSDGKMVRKYRGTPLECVQCHQ